MRDFPGGTVAALSFVFVLGVWLGAMNHVC